jgi:hypothetical protein
MPDQMIQIGSFALSRPVFNALSPLMGTIIGGLITYLVTTSAERRRWKQQKKDALAQARREGVAIALEWIEPIERCVSAASMKVSSVLHRATDQEDLFKNWPDLLSDLTRLDVPARFRVLLPGDFYARGLSIVRGLDDLRLDAVRFQQEIQIQTQAPAFQKCLDRLEELGDQVKVLRDRLTEEYEATFK